MRSKEPTAACCAGGLHPFGRKLITIIKELVGDRQACKGRVWFVVAKKDAAACGAATHMKEVNAGEQHISTGFLGRAWKAPKWGD